METLNKSKEKTIEEIILYKQLKHSIRTKKIEKFRYTINNLKNKADVIEKLKNSDWNKNHIFEKAIDYWFDKYCEYSNIQIVKFLLPFLTNLKISVYRQLKRTIEADNFDEFIFLIKVFKIDIKDFTKSNDYCDKTFKQTINSWIDRLYEQKYFGYIKLIISKLNNEYIYEYIKQFFLQDKSYTKFCFFINNYTSIENFKKFLTSEEQAKLDLWISKKIENTKKGKIEQIKIKKNKKNLGWVLEYPYDMH